MYDKPKEEFHPITLDEKHKLFAKLSKDYDDLKGCDENSTIFTKICNNEDYELLDNRPGLIVSSTSWTEDEDFSILLDALNGKLRFHYY